MSAAEIAQSLSSISALLNSAKRLGLLWGMRPATIAVSSTGAASVLAVYDGDTTQMLMQSLVGAPLAVGDRVMVMAVPPAANYILGKLDGTVLTGYRFSETVYYITSGSFSFTKASYTGLTAIRVRVVGGGGAGGGAAVTAAGVASAGSGGQGGAYGESFILETALGTTETVTVGAGGVAVSSANGGNGGTSSFGSFITAQGGDGGILAGAAASVAMSAAGGSSQTVTGDFTSQGGGGGGGFRLITFAGGGQGGTSLLGGGGWAVGDGVGINGRGPGGGGSGAANPQSRAARAGGTGGVGAVIVDVYVS